MPGILTGTTRAPMGSLLHQSASRTCRRNRCGPSSPFTNPVAWIAPGPAYVGGQTGGAELATGWANEGAVLDQIEDTITDAVQGARSRLPHGAGTAECVECGDDIPPARRKALPGATTCIGCQSGRDRRVVHSAINRRGSKDSQLR